MMTADSVTFTITKVEFNANWPAIGIALGIIVIASILFYLSFRNKD